MTKSTYLDNPEGNNMELYCETPEVRIFEVRNGDIYSHHADGRLGDGREPLDLEACFSHMSKDKQTDEPVPPDVRMGYFHLYVANLEETHLFCHELLGFDNMGLVSAGGYHHHIGFNT